MRIKQKIKTVYENICVLAVLLICWLVILKIMKSAGKNKKNYPIEPASKVITTPSDDTTKIYFQREDYSNLTPVKITPIRVVSDDGKDTLIFDDNIFVGMSYDTIYKYYIHVAPEDTIILNYISPDKKDTLIMTIYPDESSLKINEN